MSNLHWAPFAHATVVSKGFVDGTAFAADAQSLEDVLVSRQACVVACGVFDGIHMGHRRLVEDAVAHARRERRMCVIVTFDPDPSEVLGADGELGQRLLPFRDRVEGLLSLGVDIVLAYHFTPEFGALSPDAFVIDHLLKMVQVASVHIGVNFRYGMGGAGSPEHMHLVGARYGFDVVVHPLECMAGSAVSATRIRTCLARGRLNEANELLGRCHYVRGRVVHGRGEGTGFGFPTANVLCDPCDRLPSQGVYACYVTCDDQAWPAAVNVGKPPTFTDDDVAFLEANLVGFEGDLYGADVAVSFVAWLRASRCFDSIEELKNTVMGNVSWVREHLGTGAMEVAR